MRRPVALLIALALAGSGCAVPQTTVTLPRATPVATSPSVTSPQPTDPRSSSFTPRPSALPAAPSVVPEPQPDEVGSAESNSSPVPLPSESPIAVSAGVLPPRDGYLSFGSWSAARGMIALTFDDGGSAWAIRAVVAVAAATKTPVTFFPFGRSLTAHRALWREIAAAGFPIGNHTIGHRFLVRLLARKGARAVYDEIRRFAKRAERYGIPLIPVFRPPYGEHNSAVDAIAARAGFPYVATWNTTFADTASLCSGSVARHYAFATRGRQGAIVLAHVSDELTPRILAAVIARYRERKLTPVSLVELLGGQPALIDWVRAAAIGGALPTPLDITDRTHTPAELLGRSCAS